MEQPSTPEAKLNNTLHQIRPTAQQCVTPDIMPTSDPTPKSFTADRLEALLQMQKNRSFL